MKTKTCAISDTGAKKHSCPDCMFCQWCSDSRCNMCLGERRPAQKPAVKRKNKSRKKSVKKK